MLTRGPSNKNNNNKNKTAAEDEEQRSIYNGFYYYYYCYDIDRSILACKTIDDDDLFWDGMGWDGILGRI
jgi:hypothetical protein